MNWVKAEVIHFREHLKGGVNVNLESIVKDIKLTEDWLDQYE